MAGYWSLIKAEATQNYCPNPSLEDGTTSWNNLSSGSAAGNRTRTTDWQNRGAWSYELEKTGGGATDEWGASINAKSPSDFTSGESATFSVDLKVAASTTATIRVEYNSSATSETLEITGPAEGRYSVTLDSLPGTATNIIGAVFVNSATGTVYVDGAQIENKGYATTYCDGDQDGCTWLGARHGSSSTRDKRSGDGGRAFNLDSYNLFVDLPTGLGMPPIRHQSQFQAQQPGALWQGVNVDPRVIIISGTVIGTTRNDLHSQRKSLIDAIKPDAINGESFWLEYTGANSSDPIRIKVRYDAGLEFGRLSGFSENVAIRWIAHDPLWVTDGNKAAVLSEDSGTVTTPYLARRTSAGWTAVAASLNGTVRAVVELDGTIYFAGDFTNAGGVANADYIAQYDAETDTVTALGTGMDAAVHTLLAHPNGNLYAGGAFTSAGGIANTAYYARWTGSAWQSMVSAGNTFDDVVRALAPTNTGDIIVGGDFANGNGSAYARIVSNTLGAPQNYTAMGTGASGGDVYAIAQTVDGLIYAGGDYTSMGGVSNTTRIAAWSTDDAAWTALGTGVNGTVLTLLGARDGDLILGGAFTQASGTSGFNYIAAWNTVAYRTLSSAGMDGNVRAVAEDADGLLHAVGDFDSAGLLNDNVLENYAIWNGALWLYPDGGPVGATSAYAIAITTAGDVYIGSDDASGAIGAGHTTVTNNGTREAFPVITVAAVAGTDRVTWIENVDTGARLYCDFLFLASAETLTIDLRPNRRTVSSNYRGVVWEALKPSSDVGAWALAPGDNDIAVRVISGGSPVIHIQWMETFWSADGTAT
jgi:hypothetical protein